MPNTWMYLPSTEKVREIILQQCKIIRVVELTKNIFADAPDIVPVIIILQKESSEAVKQKKVVETKSFSDRTRINPEDFTQITYNKIRQNDWFSAKGKVFNLNLTPETKSICSSIRDNVEPLSTFVDVKYGIKTGDNKKYLTSTKLKENFRKALKTKEISRYRIEWKNLWLDYGSYLSGYRKDSLEVPKIVVQYIRKLSMKRRLICGFDSDGEYYPLNNYSYIVSKGKEDLRYILAILNSKLMNFYYANTHIDYNIKPTYLSTLPIKVDDKIKGKVVELVDKMLSLNNRLNLLGTTKTDDGKNIQSEIILVDKEIDELICKIYKIEGSQRKIILNS